MVETVPGDDERTLLEAATLLHDFNQEYDEPSPPPAVLARRLASLIEDDRLLLLVVRDDDEPVGVAVLRLWPSLWSEGQEAYLAELYVVPGRRGHGFGRQLITDAIHQAQVRGADYAFIVTSEEDRQAQRLYEAAGFRRTEGDGGPVMLAYEREL
jgi:ribosomal protein S18 acetylase RimI-like enzyme